MQWNRRCAAGVLAAAVFGASLLGNAVLITRARALENSLQAQRQREMTDIADAMSDIEINLQKLLIATGVRQSVSLLSETALLAHHVENGLSRLPLDMNTAADTMKFAGQMGRYAMALAAQVSGGGMLSAQDERQLGSMLGACRSLNAYLEKNGEAIYSMPLGQISALPQEGENAVRYPSLIYDGPFSDGRTAGQPKALSGERITREQAREIAARAAGTTSDQVADEADSGGVFEAFGFSAMTPHGAINVQITGQGGRVLWMMPESAAFTVRKDRETCLRAARVWLADMGFGDMQACFVQEYDGMVVANFAAVQDGVLLYPDQVKVQVSMDSGTVVGAECTQYLMNHERRALDVPAMTMEEAEIMVSAKLEITGARLCMIPDSEEERLCWEFEGKHQGAVYLVYIDVHTGAAVQILRVIDTQQGQIAI